MQLQVNKIQQPCMLISREDTGRLIGAEATTKMYH